MDYTIFSATGCVRCKLVKKYMDEQAITYRDLNIKEDGKAEFQKFYREHRPQIFRGPEGVEFPILFDGERIDQGMGRTMARVMYGPEMGPFFGCGILHGEWVDGVNLSGGDSALAEKVLAVLRQLKSASFKIEATTSGRNAELLASVLDENLIDRLIMDLPGPLPRIQELSQDLVSEAEYQKSITQVPRAPEYRFQTILRPLPQADGESAYLTPEEAGATAELVKTLTGGNRHPYLLRRCAQTDGVEPLPDAALFKYRTAARRHLVMTEIEK